MNYIKKQTKSSILTTFLPIQAAMTLCGNKKSSSVKQKKNGKCRKRYLKEVSRNCCIQTTDTLFNVIKKRDYLFSKKESPVFNGSTRSSCSCSLLIENFSYIFFSSQIRNKKIHRFAILVHQHGRFCILSAKNH